MPKRKSGAQSRDQSGKKMTFLLRFDDDLHSKVKELAESSQISVNQLMQGVARWIVQNAQRGEPIRDAEGHLQNRPQAGCLWFGKPASPPPHPDECKQLAKQSGGSPDEWDCWTEGRLVFALDFTERRVLLDEDENREGVGIAAKKSAQKPAREKQ